MLNKIFLLINFSVICLLSVIISTNGNLISKDNDKPFDYSQHKFIKILPKKAIDLIELKILGESYKVDYWNHPSSDLRPVLTLIAPEKNGQRFLTALNNSQIAYSVIENSFQRLIDEEKQEMERIRFRQSSFDYESTFHKYDEIVAELTRVAKNNTKAVYSNIGKSYEGRQIPVVTVTDPSVQNKKSIILECGIHAREWASPATCLWIMNNLLTDPKNDPLLKKYEFVIIPSLNPDGYVYSHTYNRMWRKTRSPQIGGQKGADPNRNFDSHFGESGVTKDPSADAYPGSKPFSEVESKSMANFVLSKRGTIAAYFSIHSFSQLWMYPYGYTTSPPANSAQLAKLSSLAVDAIRATNGLVFSKGTIAKTIYKASGSSVDWAYDAAGVKVAFALELRDKGQYGFILPAGQIKATALETWNGIKAVANNL